MLAPVSSIQRGSQGSFVYLVKPDNTVSVQVVTTGISEGDTVEITKGLAANDNVVVDGADSLREGSKIQIPAQKADKPDTAKGAAKDPAKDGAKDSSQHKHKKHSDE